MRHLALILFVSTALTAQDKPTNAEKSIFARYPAKHVALPAKEPRAIITTGDRVFRSRLKWTLDDNVNFADHFTINAWGCGASCLIIGIADHVTGRTYLVPKSLSSSGPGRRLTFDRSSKAVHMVGYFNEKDPSDRWYVWNGSSLKLKKNVVLPDKCFTPWEEAEKLLPTSECNFQPPDADE